MKWLILWFLILQLPFSALAESTIKYGAAIPKNQEKFGTAKALFLGYQEEFWVLTKQYEAGFWSDSVGNGRKSSGMLSASLGVTVYAGYVYFQALSGPGLITSPDNQLGGNFQFNNDFAFGFKDLNTGNTIGFNYKHVSSAGFEQPNRGRDFIMFRVGVAF